MKTVVIAYAIGVHLILVIVLLKSDFVDRVMLKVGWVEKTPAHVQHYQMMLHFHQSVDRNVLPDSVLFFGDSLVQGLHCSRVHPSAVNYGIGGDTTRGLLDRLETHESLKRASAVVFSVGVNDIHRCETKEILKNFGMMAEVVPPHVPIVYSAIFPVRESVLGVRMNDSIGELNEALEKLCGSGDRSFFCDPTPSMTDPDGSLKDSLHIGDGLHLNAEGNEIWIVELTKTLNAALLRKRNFER